MAVEAASIIPISIFEETKRLDLRRNQAFHNASGGDKRDRLAELLNPIYAHNENSGDRLASAALVISVCVA